MTIIGLIAGITISLTSPTGGGQTVYDLCKAGQVATDVGKGADVNAAYGNAANQDDMAAQTVAICLAYKRGVDDARNGVLAPVK